MDSFGRFVSLLIALLFIFFGVLFLLSNLGLLIINPIRLLNLLWPLLLIAIGLYFIWLNLRPRRKRKAMTLSEDLGDVKRASIDIDFGAGELKIGSLKDSDKLLEGSFVAGADKQVSRSQNSVKVKLRHTPEMFWPFSSHFGSDWRVEISAQIPLSLRLNTGASRVNADLSDNKVELVELNTGASDVTIRLPKESGYTKVVVKGGAADIKLEVAEGVAARIKSTGALSSLRIDEKRFPKIDSQFVSPDFESAQNKVYIEVNTGVSSVAVY